MDWKEELINIYVDRGAVLCGDFKLTGGGRSDVYLDGRLATTYPRSLEIIADQFAIIIKGLEEYSTDLNLIAPPLSGIPIAAALSIKLNIPFVIDRGKPKHHGTSKRFEGRFFDNPNCVLIDDLITKGTTLLHSIHSLREIGKTVNTALVVVDREEGGRAQLSSIGVNLISLLKKKDLITAFNKTA